MHFFNVLEPAGHSWAHALKWNSRLLFLVMTTCFTPVTDFFHLLKIINSCSKQWKDALTSATFSVIYRTLSLNFSAQIIH